MTFQKLGTKYQNYFAGGYISSLLTYDTPDDIRSYISFTIKVKTGGGGETKTVYIMVYKMAGYGNSKYPNPMINVICDCYEQGRPIACCYYGKDNCNILACCYTNFSVTAPPEAKDTANTKRQSSTIVTDSVLLDDSAEMPF